MVGKFERRKDVLQELTESGANTIGHIATIVTGAVRDVTREIGGFVTDAIEMREATVKARTDEVHGPAADDVTDETPTLE